MSSADLITNSTCDGIASRAHSLLDIDPNILDDAALAQHTLEFERLRSQFDAAQMRVVHAASSRQVHRVDRHRSTGTWLAAELRQNRTAVKRKVRSASTVVEHLPLVLGALDGADINDDHVRLLLTAEHRGLLKALVRDQEVLLRWARTETFATFREFFEAWCILNDPRDPSLLDHKAFDDRHMIWVEGVDGAVMIEVDTTNLGFAQIQASLQPVFDRLLEQDWQQARAEHGSDVTVAHLPRTERQRWHDALLAVLRAGAGGDDPGAAVVVNVVIDAETLDRAANDQETQPQRPSEDATSYRAETLSGQRLSPQQILMCALAGHVRRVVLSASTIDFEMSKKVRLFKGAKRTGLMIRDRHCQGRGCDIRADRCEADHIVPYARAGPTTPANGRMLCSACHRHKSMLETLGLRN